ncbi:fimbria/pilus periplasmic chaperone [Enterovibrio sp. 27052020O]|uniref:fimbria/pilus periplasmic chaperone n=1 Tax=Enterovibrio sp. 27052020O TaxID=3241166 RepID=UPI00388FAFFD
MRLVRISLMALLLFSPISKAFELLPMVSFFSTQSTNSEKFFQINNTTDQPLPIEIFVKSRSIEGDKPESLSDSDDFFVFPPQVLIPAGKTQMVKVKYIGSPIESSTSYRVIFSQLPIQDDETASSIKMLFQIGALVFVSPDSATSLVSAAVNVENKEAPSLVLENTGTDIVIIPQLELNVKTNVAAHTWKWDDISSLLNRQFLVPGERVHVQIDALLAANEIPNTVDVKGFQ